MSDVWAQLGMLVDAAAAGVQPVLAWLGSGTIAANTTVVMVVVAVVSWLAMLAEEALP